MCWQTLLHDENGHLKNYSNEDLSNTTSSLDKIINQGFISFILFSISMGFLALLTPCVFPMIPLTVSFFTKGAEHKSKAIYNAGLYGLFILLLRRAPVQQHAEPWPGSGRLRSWPVE